MKWGNPTNKVAKYINAGLAKVIGNKGLYILLALAALVLLVGANDKWGQ